MALYVIGDLHLSIAVPSKKMDIFDPIWKNHEEKIEKNWRKWVRPEDTVVIAGDFSWGRNLEECRPDFDFIRALPGRKIFLRGNHDMFWDAKKTERLNDYFGGEFFFLQNNFALYRDYALVGTKGYCYEGLDSIEHFLKIRDREMARLQKSFDAAKLAGCDKFIMFLHYPPTTIGEQESPFTRIAQKYHVEQVIYAHCHGRERFDDSFKGMVGGIEYSLASADYLRFRPKLVLE